MSETRVSAGLVAALFSAGTLVGIVLTHCSDPPPPNTAAACQGLVWSSWIAEQQAVGLRAPVLVSSARQLVSDIRRCNGLSTTFIDDPVVTDPFSIGGDSPSDAGIYRSR